MPGLTAGLIFGLRIAQGQFPGARSPVPSLLCAALKRSSATISPSRAFIPPGVEHQFLHR